MADIYVFNDDEPEETHSEESEGDWDGTFKDDEIEIWDPPGHEGYFRNLEDGSSSDADKLSQMAYGSSPSDQSCNSTQQTDGQRPRYYMSPCLRFGSYVLSKNMDDKIIGAKLTYDALRYATKNEPGDLIGTVDHLEDLLDTNHEKVLTCIMEQLPQIACFCVSEKDHLGDLLSDVLYPKAVELLIHEDDQVRKTSQAALLVLLEQELVKCEYVYDKVCVKVMKYLQLDDDALRAEIMALLCKMMPLFARDYCRSYFVSFYPELCCDPHSTVRKICAGSFVDFATTAGEERTRDLLLPKFIKLCKDTVWSVRKTCAETFTRVSHTVSLEVRRDVLAPAFQSFLQDNSRWVRLAAYQGLGMFLSTFADSSKTGLQYNEDGSYSFFQPTYVESDDISGSTSLSNALPEIADFNELNFWKISLPAIELPADLEIAETNEEDAQKSEDDAESTGSTSESNPDDWLSSEQDHGPEADSGVEDEPETCDIYETNSDSEKNSPLDLSAVTPTDNPSEIEEDSGANSPSKRFTTFRAFRPMASGMPSDWNEPLPLTIPLTIDQNIIPSSLLLEYINLTDPHRSDTIDSEIRKDCAYAFPGVVLTLGRQYWPGLLVTFQTLVADIDWKVRRTLAFSLHELAVILGKEITERDLFPVFLEFIRDLDEIRLGILRHLSDFVMPLSKEYRLKFLPRLNEFTRLDNPSDWRFRLELAQQLIPLSNCYEEEECWSIICPLAFHLLAGKVVHIRRICYAVLSHLAHKLSLDSDHIYLEKFCTRLRSHFAEGSTWSKRQSYVYTAGQIMEDNNLSASVWATYFLPPLLDLSADSVPNIRMAVAKVFNTVLLNKDYFNDSSNCEYEKIRNTLTVLKDDTDRDVRYFAQSDSDCGEFQFACQFLNDINE